MPEVETEDLEPVPPLLEVRLLRVARRRVAREPCRHDQPGARTQQLDPGLVADLHAAAGEERDASAQVGRLGSLREVEVAARPAHLVVEVVYLCVCLLADVAIEVLRLAERLLGLVLRARVVRRREDRLLAQDADARLGTQALVAARLLGLLPLPLVLDPSPALDDARVEDVAGGREQPRALLDRKPLQDAAIADDRFERLDGVAQRLRGVRLLLDRHGDEGSVALACAPGGSLTRVRCSPRR